MTVTAKKPKSETQSNLPRRVGIKEFKDKATQLLAADEPFVVERHGKPIGYYTPLGQRDHAGARAAVDRLDATMERIAARRGLTVNQLETLMFTDPQPTDAPAND